MQLHLKHILDVNDFSIQQIHTILEEAEAMDELLQNKSQTANQLLQGKIMATLFFEPSTRTRLSFESAMKRLGGGVIGFNDWEKTSLMKGETLADTITVVGEYADVIVFRHPEKGSAQRATEATPTPIINGGDGSNQHPTQTFLDMYTLYKEKKRLNNLHICFMGDLKYGRTVHSLIQALDRFPNNTFSLISPSTLALPENILQQLKNTVHISTDLNTQLKDVDIVYATRIQKERFAPGENYHQIIKNYKLTSKSIAHAKKDIKIMHPLPRVGEIHHDLDHTSHALYFKQARNGLPVRMALLKLVLNSS